MSFHWAGCHVRRLNLTEENKYRTHIQVPTNTLQRPHFIYMERVSKELVSRNVWLSNEYHSSLPFQQNIFVMHRLSAMPDPYGIIKDGQVLTDRAGSTCLYSVYIIPAQVCSFLSPAASKTLRTLCSIPSICIYFSFFFSYCLLLCNQLDSTREVSFSSLILCDFTMTYRSSPPNSLYKLPIKQILIVSAKQTKINDIFS